MLYYTILAPTTQTLPTDERSAKPEGRSRPASERLGRGSETRADSNKGRQRGAARPSASSSQQLPAAAASQPALLEHWRDLTTSDHVYYIATKHHSDAEVHDYFSPYDSPHAAFATVMSALDALEAVVAGARR